MTTLMFGDSHELKSSLSSVKNWTCENIDRKRELYNNVVFPPLLVVWIVDQVIIHCENDYHKGCYYRFG